MASHIGTIRLGNKHKYSDFHPEPGEVVVEIGRPNLLANYMPIDDSTCRATSLLAFKIDFGAEMKQKDGPRYREVCQLAKLVREGQDLILMCWCHPLPCHGESIKAAIEEMIHENPSDIQ